MRERLAVPLEEDAISAEVVRIMRELYREDLPLLPGADEALRRIAGRWPTAIASSSNREIIDLVLERTGGSRRVRVSVASEDVERGKPSPDVYLEAARRLGAEWCVGIEDSGPGIRSAHAAGFGVVAVPNPHFPPEAEVLALANVVLDSLEQLSPEVIERSGDGA
jgi:HAD superfamily hydrolase (TIGR01509 family)